MGRPPRHDADKLLDAAVTLAAKSGPASVTMAAVARAAAAPSGSVYHRFPDRSALLAALWLRTLKRFQTGMVAALNTDPPQQAAVDAARHVVEWSRRNPSEARVLLHGATDFGESAWSESARKSTAEAQAALAAALRGLGRRLGASGSRELDRLVIAVVDLPYATVRRYLLSGKPIPAHAARLVEQGTQALLTH